VPDQRILLISPVFNEGAHIERVVRAVARQELPPTRWIIVDDKSTDGSIESLRDWEERLDFLEVVQGEWPEEDARGADGLAAAREAVTFNQALARVRLEDYDYVGKLDGDIELPPDHFRRLMDRYAADPELGIAGCMLVEPSGDRWVKLGIPAYHVHGATKLYSVDCFTKIGGIQQRLGWDVIDETYARMHGYRTHTFPDLEARHLRPSGSAAGQLRGRARAGEVAYIVSYEPWWVVPRAAKVALSRPYLISGLAFLYGYVHAATRRRGRVDDPEYRRFVRRELLARIHPRRLVASAQKKRGL
jgi:biofilm PGA synthesis N-glycosyltransferase PgaC